ncbi:MAG: 50S ribosomal protein L24 [Patescibacteria group bacterium]|nr:50S ribosomal protein L24 [bacterium]MDZ4227587.1 50S ribosomal protein L24 [Patescibacteria group bacterium]
MKLKKGDKVVVIAGKAKGAVSTIVRTIRERDLVILDGVNMTKKHLKPSAQNRKGQIIDKTMPMHASNVMLADPKTGKPTRIRISHEKGKRMRIAVKSGQQVN